MGVFHIAYLFDFLISHRVKFSYKIQSAYCNLFKYNNSPPLCVTLLTLVFQMIMVLDKLNELNPMSR